MNIKKGINAIFNESNGDLQTKIFAIASGTGLLALLITCITAFCLGANALRSLLFFSTNLLIFTIIVITLKLKKVQIGAILISLMLITVLTPTAFLTSGGVAGSTPLWLLFAIVYISFTVRGKARLFLVILEEIVIFASYYVAYKHPELVNSPSTDYVYQTSFISIALITITCSLLITLLTRMYQLENETASEQKIEIEELNQAQNRFFSSISHEIRTPINTIIGLNEMILREENISDEIAEDAQSIQAASRMLLALINDVLDMSKIESGNMDVVPVSYETGIMLSEIVNMIWIKAKEKNLAFHVEVAPDLPSMLYGDEVRIKQVLINILNNAIKYTTEGSVTFSIQCKKVNMNRVQVTYTISDTGIGIKKENIPYLFDAFKRIDQTKNRYIEGTGLGLAIVKQLVTLMGGEISVNSIYTKGSTFVITLEQDIMNNSSIGELNLEARHIMNNREQYRQIFEAPDAIVLIVDDNETNLMVAEKLLRDTEIRTDTALSGKEALEKSLVTRYDAILMDHLMPEMDGIECLHAIRSQTGGLNKDTPIIALTANAGSDSQVLYRKEGFDGYLAKPINGLLLEAALLKVLPKDLVTISDASGAEHNDSQISQLQNKKVPILITADSVCDLPAEYQEQHRIPILPYHVHTEEGVFLDGKETETDGILAYMKAKGKKANSEPPDVKDYEDFFAEQLLHAQYVIHITMTSTASQGYVHALEAAKSFNNVTVVDSGHLSTGMGLFVMEAKRLSITNLGPEAIVDELNKIREKISTSFIMGTTEYLARSKRISRPIDTLCRTLMLHPVIRLKKGHMRVTDIKMGGQNVVLDRYIHSALKDKDSIDRSTIIITIAGFPLEQIEGIRKEVLDIIPFEKVYVQKASPTISTNCGPGSFGLMFMRK